MPRKKFIEEDSNSSDDGSKSVPGRRLFRVFRLLSSPNASKSHRVKKNGRSFIPSDGLRDERLESMHLYYSNFVAPVDDDLARGIKVLDVGCGGGGWLMDMASDYPNSEFVGTDIVDLFLKHGTPPQNCKFMLANTVKGLPFEDNTFDFVHQRSVLLLMVFDFSPSDWATAMKEMIRVTKPGGWIQITEGDIIIERSGPLMKRFLEAAEAISKSRGVDVRVVRNLGSLFSSLDNVEVDCVSCPTGWQDKWGDMALQNLLGFVKATRAGVMPILNITDKEFEDMVSKMAQECKEYKSLGSLPYAFGQKKRA
ncbi:S-adenosyl-L-methionine-dependent methyltransferase [Jimgerdemannia flammicorona]|uniref:S-adenosyl-L-methionine-dependent methyltransferase n=1 Tax=Jimgerdemannia flammicorona TaxID=994334 RepID=A0A433DAZ8_9FUNG|nr:S-adenosyl-L-methionine-dependent methyltransferase [Jimgerdemannia flammicorona]